MLRRIESKQSAEVSELSAEVSELRKDTKLKSKLYGVLGWYAANI